MIGLGLSLTGARRASAGGATATSTVTFTSAGSGTAANSSTMGTATTVGIAVLLKGDALINLSGANATAALLTLGDNSSLYRIVLKLQNDGVGTSVRLLASDPTAGNFATGYVLKSSLSATKYYTLSVSAGATTHDVELYDGATNLASGGFAGGTLGQNSSTTGILSLNNAFYATSEGGGAATYDAVWMYNRALTGAELQSKPAANASGQVSLWDFDSGDLTIGGTTTSVASKTTAGPAMVTTNANTTYA